MFGVLVTLLTTTTIAYGINWNGNWAASCDFIGNDLANSLSTGEEDCSGRCVSTPGCTHYTWTNYNGGTCYMKKYSVSKHDAVPKNDQDAVCGIIVGNVMIYTDAEDEVNTASVDGVATLDEIFTNGTARKVIIDRVGGLVAGNVSGVITSKINWNGKNFAASCDFVGNDLTNASTTANDCGGCCASTPGCTHYTWTNYNGGTCYMKKDVVFKHNAVLKYDQGAVCGIIDHNLVGVGNSSGVFSGNLSEVVASTINWNGNNWATSCHFIGNDLEKVATTAKDCGGCCATTPGCTHYTWTNYNGGTCYMKKNSVSKHNAIPKHNQDAVCGVVVDNVEGVVSGNSSVIIAPTINWNGKNWATSCHFIGNDLANVLTTAKECDRRCSSTPGCTHYTWTNYNGGTCWMKKNSVSRNNAVPRHDHGAVCGIIVSSSIGFITGTASGVGASRINWNGKNWAASCEFVGNDLANTLTRANDCGGRCASTQGCTHYTWTNYNGGTCYMKKNSVPKSNAIPKYDQGAVCGVNVGNAGEVHTGTTSEVRPPGIHWHENNWIASCDLFGKDVTNVLTRAEDCGSRCVSTPDCTHYSWTNYNGGTCWMKRNTINTVPKYEQGLLFTDHFRRPMPYHNQIIINLA